MEACVVNFLQKFSVVYHVHLCSKLQASETEANPEVGWDSSHTSMLCIHT